MIIYNFNEEKLIENLKILQQVEQESGCHILLAQKAFSMYSLYPLIGTYLSGTTASGLYEARLGYEEMGKENHVYAPAYKRGTLIELCLPNDSRYSRSSLAMAGSRRLRTAPS